MLAYLSIVLGPIRVGRSKKAGERTRDAIGQRYFIKAHPPRTEFLAAPPASSLQVNGCRQTAIRQVLGRDVGKLEYLCNKQALFYDDDYFRFVIRFYNIFIEFLCSFWKPPKKRL